MEEGLYDLIEKILQGVSFIAIGGGLAIVFFFIFAPSILGLKELGKQIERLQEQAKEMSEQLKRIAEHPGENGDERKEEGKQENV